MSLILDKQTIENEYSQCVTNSVKINSKSLKLHISNILENSKLAKFFDVYKRMLNSYENAVSEDYSNILLKQYLDNPKIRTIAKENSKIQSILKNNSMDEKIWLNNVVDIKAPHLLPTLIYSKNILKNLSKKYQYLKYEKANVEKAAVVHDIGKIFIPKEILEKPTNLTKDEQRIVQTHAELGSELLKAQNCNSEIVHIVNNHHKNIDGSGYSGSNSKASLLSQIVTVADKYCALRSKRSYKDAMDSKQAIEILNEEVQKGKVNKEVFEALAKSVF